ncbi:armadillo-like helical domain-containing protein 4 isoform X1 [Chanodichthys erythropterus]|uniref:armadillo-like helical domain-containing protein 4 isoform X1 n=1 Tax=Chanodichthys erythropterus TaxID=933992 RepID=UPI00351E6D28
MSVSQEHLERRGRERPSQNLIPQRSLSKVRMYNRAQQPFMLIFNNNLIGPADDDVTQSSVTHQPLTVVHVAASKPKTDTDLETKEEPDEDEEDEEMDSDEEEEESEEDLMESTMAPHTRPPYSLIPPPPVWVQRNQGLGENPQNSHVITSVVIKSSFILCLLSAVRSWVELIREKAGYVSGMLAPVGIGIAGALLLVGALYSIRLIHRKRRDSFKHQRRKPPREVRSGPDNAMLLADSSEDEF